MLKMSDWEFCGAPLNHRSKTDCAFWATLDWSKAKPSMSGSGPVWSVPHLDNSYHSGNCHCILTPRLGKWTEVLARWCEEISDLHGRQLLAGADLDKEVEKALVKYRRSWR